MIGLLVKETVQSRWPARFNGLVGYTQRAGCNTEDGGWTEPWKRVKGLEMGDVL